MADLTKIFSGMESGPEAIQSNFEKMNQTVENMGGQLNGLQWTEETTEGIVILDNRFKLKGGYSYCQIGNRKLVYLKVELVFAQDCNEFISSKVFTVPDSLKSSLSLTARASDQLAWWYDGKFEIVTNNYQKMDFKAGATAGFIQFTYAV